MRKKAILVALLAYVGMHSFAQEKTINGKVIDEKDGKPVSGASVTAIKGKTGAVTAPDGSFSLSVPNSAHVLKVSSVNYAGQEIAIDSKTEFVVKLAADEKLLSEVVVIGFGTQQKREVTGALATITADKIKNVPVQSFEQALSGKAAGVNVIMPNGVLNSPAVIKVRGVNSINGSLTPLIVIDGVAVFNGDLSSNLSANNVLGNLNPADIEDIQVLKDAASAAIYGSRAGNGVMLITTKKGRPGKAKVTYDAWLGWTKAYKTFDVLNAQDYVAIKNQAIANQPNPLFAGHVPGSPLFFLDTMNGKLVDTKWADEVYQTGFQHNHNLSVSGAANGTKYYFSTSYTKQDGMVRTNEFERQQIRMNVEQKVNNWFTVGSTINFSRSGTKSPSTGSGPGQAFNTAGVAKLAFNTAPNVSVYTADGRYNIMGIDNPTQRNQFNQIGRNKNLTNSGFFNPALLRDLNKISSVSDQFQGTVYADIKIIKGLNFRSQYGANWTTVEDKTFYNSLHGDGIQTASVDDDGTAYNVVGKYTIRNFQNYFTYNFSLYNLHNFTLTAGSEEQKMSTNRWGAQRSGLTEQFYDEFQGNFTTNNNPVSNIITENYLRSFFGRLNYNYDNRYFFSGNFRRDGYSAFAEGKKWGSFAGASAAWSISNENFWKNSGISKTISSFRLRGSYGQVGNATAVGNFASISTYSSSVYGQGYPTLFFSQAGNKDLGWERSTKLDAGVQFGLFNDRVTGDVSYYNTKLKDLIIDRPVPPSRGIPGNTIAANAASMYNKGIEITLNAKLIDKKDFNWNVSLNVTTQKNEVTALAPGLTDIIGITQFERTNMTRVGYPVGNLFAVKTNGVDAESGQRIFLDAKGKEVLFNFAEAAASRWHYRDGSVAPPISIAADGKMLGSALPTTYGGFTNNFYYRGFDLTVDAFFSLGNYVYFGSRAGLLDQRYWNNNQEVKNSWKQKGDVTDIPKLVYGDNISNGSSIPIDANVFKADFFRVRTIALGYTLPKKLLDKINISSLRIYGQLLNPFIITSYPGIDPEISSNGASALTPGVDRNTVGQAKTVTVGINVGF